MQKSTNSADVVQIPFDRLFTESESQRDRIVREVMEALFSKLPTQTKNYNFKLSDGTKCWIKAFSEPHLREDGELAYGFDIKLGEGSELSHLEFTVKCSGWERALHVPNPNTI